MKLSYDLYYLRNANVFFDLMIALKTIRLVSGGQGSVPTATPHREDTSPPNAP